MIRIPAIDILDGKIVRLKQGSYDEVTVYHEDPMAFAKTLAGKGFKRLHVVDLNGARDGELTNLDLIGEIVKETRLEVQSGGGIRTFEDVETCFNAGYTRVVSSSMAVRRPAEWLACLRDFGGDKCIFGMDLKDGAVAVGGWLETTDETLEEIVEPMLEVGLKEVLCTDISRDGMMTGPNVPMYAELKHRFPGLKFIASGGVSKQEDLQHLETAGLFACVVGRAWLEGKVNL